MIFRHNPTNPAIGEIIYDKIAHAFQVYTGQNYFTIDITKECVLCHVEIFKHDTAIDHPFFENNLEILEWKSEQADKRQQV